MGRGLFLDTHAIVLCQHVGGRVARSTGLGLDLEFCDLVLEYFHRGESGL